MMFTRWHEDDLAGAFAYEEDGETPRKGWCVLRLPALAEKGDPLGREEGAALCPQLVPRAALEEKQEEDPLWFACMQQGRPSHESGSMFAKTRIGADGVARYHHYHTRGDEFRVVGADKSFQADSLLYFVMVDTATSKRTTADFTVFALFAYDTDSKVLLLIDRFRDRISTESHASSLLSFLRPHAHRKVLFVGVENKTFGTGLINELRADHPELVIIPIKADRDKVSRAVPAAEAVKAGKILFPAPTERPWTVEWENEMAKFPNAKHDDQVDTLSMAWHKVQDYAYTPVEAEPESEPTHVELVRRQLHRKKNSGGHDYLDALDLLRRT